MINAIATWSSRGTHNRLSGVRLALAMFAAAFSGTATLRAQPAASHCDDEVVDFAADGRIVTPVNQVLTPYAQMIDLPGMRPLVLAASPDGTLIVTARKTSEIVVIDRATAGIRQRVAERGQRQFVGLVQRGQWHRSSPPTLSDG